MAIKMITPISQIEKMLKYGVDQNEIAMAEVLCDVGRKCVKIAKDLPQNGSRAGYPVPYEYLLPHQENYVDWTQNLRKSISWAVIKNGQVYDVDLGPIGNTRLYFEELKKDYPTGLVLLVMATGNDPKTGESYAYYVQALGYDVLKSAQLQGEQIAQQLLRKLFNA